MCVLSLSIKRSVFRRADCSVEKLKGVMVMLGRHQEGGNCLSDVFDTVVVKRNVVRSDIVFVLQVSRRCCVDSQALAIA
jgi:hypothetical protein